MLDLSDKVVLVTGGTRGIGLATALAFGRCGARTVLTHAFGTADEAELRERFRADGAPEPWCVVADVTRAEDTAALMTALAARVGRVDVLVSNAAPANLVHDLDDYTERSLLKSLRACAWPTFEYVTSLRAHLGRYPRYVVAMSSDGPDRYTESYDFVAASKAVLETLCRYLQFRLKDEPVNINVVRSRAIRTDAFDSTFGADFYSFLRGFVSDGWFMTASEVADAALALCSGLFDGVRGQVLTVDRGSTFADGISFVHDQRGGTRA